jgi:four helix bundle suffix protein
LTPDQVRGRLYKPYTETPASPETGANTLICLIHQANYLLDQQLRALEQGSLKDGGFTEKLYHARQQMRNSGKKP